MVIARALPDSPVTPKTSNNDFDRKPSKPSTTFKQLHKPSKPKEYSGIGAGTVGCPAGAASEALSGGGWRAAGWPAG
eukprot:15512578-Heterocapsa_arctica.AAC.1